MCRVTVGETSADEALQRLQEELEQLQLQQSGACSIPDFRGIPGCKGSGPRLFCGHVPKEATEDLVRAHFSRWGTVTDVYFPRHKKTLKRRPFCFVTFASIEPAERALAESPLNICGIPIKNLTMVEDRDAYYRTKHATTRAALLQALQSIGNSANGQLGPDQLNNLAALLAMEGVTAEAIMALLPQSGLFNGGSSLGVDAAALLGASSRFGTGPVSGGLPSMLGGAPATDMYDAYQVAAPQMGQRMSPAPYQSNGRSYNVGPAGYGMPSGLPPMDAQQFNTAQQALLASRLQQSAGMHMPPPPASAALMQQYGGMNMMQFAPQPQYAPAPHLGNGFNSMQQQQLFPRQAPHPPAPANWGLAGQQPTRSLPPMMVMPAGLAASPHGSSGTGSPLECMPPPQISLDEALAALSKLKAAQQGSTDSRAPVPPSSEILAGLGSTFTNSPLTGSPTLGTSPPSEAGLLASCNNSMEQLPLAHQASMWACDGLGRRS